VNAQHDLRKVVAWMCGTLMSFSALAISLRSLAGTLNVLEILALRNVGGILILGAYALLFDRGGIGAPRPLRVHLLRNVFHFGGQACWALGLTLLPLATVFALEFTTPAWTMVLAVLFLRERLTTARVGAVVLGFIGVMVILRPGLGSFQPAALIVLLAAMMFGVQITTTKFLTGSNSVLNIMLWMNVMQLPMYLLANVATGGKAWFLASLHASDAVAVVVLCASGLMAHVCLTNAFRWSDATMVTPIDFLRIPFIAVVGAVFYGERLDPLVLLGAAISATGIVWMLRDGVARRTQPVGAVSRNAS
jgi:drug/metabolite transporter (DMT)-like permease